MLEANLTPTGSSALEIRSTDMKNKAEDQDFTEWCESGIFASVSEIQYAPYSILKRSKWNRLSPCVAESTKAKGSQMYGKLGFE